jgi:nucleotide-binding universal stress UspA family protein
MTTKAVLVGLSPDIDSLATLTWAAEYAGSLHAPLRVVLAGATDADAPASVRALSNTAATVRDRFPQLSLSASVAEEELTEALLIRSHDAHVVVVDRDTGRHNIASAVAAEATCPVAAVAPGAVWDDDARPVMVGADGTDHSEQALRWGIAEADRLGVGVRVVHCQPHGPTGAIAAEQRNAVFDLVALFAGRYPAMSVQLHTLTCAPAEALTRHSQFASMVVMGHRRQSLGGRVYRKVLHDAACPVVIAGPSTSLDVALTAASAPSTARSSR